MFLLILVSLLWAPSFGLIKHHLAGLDPVAVAVVRLAGASIAFVPALRWRRVPPALRLPLLGMGALQFGIMYVLYLKAFAYLESYEVALFTILTPLWVAGLAAVMERSWRWTYAAAGLLAVIGTGVIVWYKAPESLGRGFLLVQGSNVCFAIGQLIYRRLRSRLPADTTDAAVFALPYAGALLATLVWSLASGSWHAFHPGAGQWAVLAFLGVVASGAGFYLWNLGATRVNAGTLAASNNLKVPLAVLCSLTVFGEPANLPRLAIGGMLILGGVWLAERRPKSAGRITQ